VTSSFFGGGLGPLDHRPQCKPERDCADHQVDDRRDLPGAVDTPLITVRPATPKPTMMIVHPTA
jgi:hypothetical protein